MKKTLLFLVLLNIGISQSQNIIQNGSFELFTGTKPDSWELMNGKTIIENSIKSDGSSSLKGTTDMVPNPSSIWLSQDFTLSDTETYTLKFDYFIPGTNLTNFIERLGYELRLNKDSDAFFFPPLVNTTIVYGSWQTITADFKILFFKSPATSASIKLTLSASTGTGFNPVNVYFDNVSIVKKGTLGNEKFENGKSPVAYISNQKVKLSNEYKDIPYQVFSIDGKVIRKSKGNDSDSIDISELAKGIYVLNFVSTNTSIKFVK